ncbi:MAG: 2-oxoacid:acceptor oxidoreductase family protein [Candidatus Methanomethylophilaceae archaeon]|jgi:2-oxoglutarate ferredoxin oxidoreductase subunit gamma|nr:2-oxoacid:acceptor oxidoreductase family protein [Candidatus Methanomethylophilaceae archaeon]MDI9378249.1 2-oxoacid:acceptor oxidoreductase family protein [Candidatus Thermoplasmatota archaeon]MDD2779363.1 2-oxoacid:acceptor oxidoreductase family protein [Candidatus Methanomethylophilaceae archaeon]MDD3128168.1 2-oxoacid:acceptor oxidoreductase family protein [Candidatus Methanomethylophilaceae archaeon]MDD4119218.1 2-oxoacid:acceptor oxidoreductase family protein [Candidatus Methanomethylo
MSDLNILLAGFGGQGVLFTGKVMAYAGLMEGKEISWLPSYGPEMRGGTANCSVCISDRSIGSPLVVTPDVLIAMNLPSLEKFEDSVVPGGLILVDSSLIDKKVERTDVRTVYIPASELADKNDLKGSSNMIILGKMFRETGFCTEDNLLKGIRKSVPARKSELYDTNVRAVRIGMSN